MTNGEITAESGSEIYVSCTGTRVNARATASNRIALAMATCGVGYIPLVPATWASAVTTGVYWLLIAGIANAYSRGLALGFALPPLETFRLTATLVLLITLGLAGVWASTKAERHFGRKDPKPVVIDEVVGQVMTFLFIPYSAGLGLIVIGFFVFRAFDIFKPYPIRRLEALDGGLGIMADDALAGAYASTLMLLLTYLPWFK
jgi:phosphatidylglycerophosphatase A